MATGSFDTDGSKTRAEAEYMPGDPSMFDEAMKDYAFEWSASIMEELQCLEKHKVFARVDVLANVDTQLRPYRFLYRRWHEKDSKVGRLKSRVVV